MGHWNNDSAHITDLTIKGEVYSIYGIYDERSEDGIGYEYYDVFDSAGNCINEGDAFYDYPTLEEIEALLDSDCKNFVVNY
jgi:hypothetical protein